MAIGLPPTEVAVATRADIVRIALAENGYHDGQGYDELSKYTQSFGITYGIAYCDIFCAWVYEQAGIPLPKMGSWIRSGSQYCPDSYNYAASHGAVINSWQAQPGDQVIFNWNGDGQPLGGESHTELVEAWANDWLYTVGGNSGPSNVDGFKGTGGVHRHVWYCPYGVGNSLIEGVIDTSQLVTFSTSEEFTVDAEAKARFDQQDKAIASLQLGIAQLVQVFETGGNHSFGMQGIKDVMAQNDKILAQQAVIAAHNGVKL